MSELEKLEERIQKLSPEELKKFRKWFVEFDAQLWDEQIAADAAVNDRGEHGSVASQPTSAMPARKSISPNTPSSTAICRYSLCADSARFPYRAIALSAGNRYWNDMYL